MVLMDLPLGPAVLVLQPHPSAALERRLFADLGAPHLFESSIGQLDDMEPVEGDGRFRQMPTDACDIGLAHVDAGSCDAVRVTAMLPEVFGECLDRVRVAALTCKEQPAGVQVMEEGDVVVASPRCRLIDTDSRHIAEVLLSARRGNVVLKHAPYPIVSDTEQISDSLYRHLPGERDHEGVEQLAEPAAAARPGNRHLSGLPALAAGDARYSGMDEGLVLKKTQVFRMRPVWPRLIYFAVKFQGMRSSMRLVLWSCRRSSTQVSHASGLTPFMRAVSIKV